MRTTMSQATGSLKVGTAGLDIKEGDQIQIEGDKHPFRQVSGVMGKGEKRSIYFLKGQYGPVPQGEIQYEILS